MSENETCSVIEDEDSCNISNGCSWDVFETGGRCLDDICTWNETLCMDGKDIKLR